MIKDADIKVDNDIVTLSFFLPAGAYATTIMRELIAYKDMTERVDVDANRRMNAEGNVNKSTNHATEFNK